MGIGGQQEPGHHSDDAEESSEPSGEERSRLEMM